MPPRLAASAAKVTLGRVAIAIRAITKWKDEHILALFRGDPAMTVKRAAIVLKINHQRVRRALDHRSATDRRHVPHKEPDRRAFILSTAYRR
jgi:hypothetical protein